MGNSLDKILPGLYVGGIRASAKEKILNDNGITHVLSIHDTAAPLFKDRQYLCIRANDNASQDLTQFFPQCTDFIHQARLNGGNVLIHCFAGISRSVTVTIAYIMTVTDLNWREALKAIRGARNCANPNFGFQRQLLAFYHDSLQEEKARFFAKFPQKLQYDDEKECRRLIAAHEAWILTGNEGVPTADIQEENTYPLSHNAYSTAEKNDSHPNQNSAPTNGDDEEDDDGYIDMTKNSFRKPARNSNKSVSATDTPVSRCSETVVKQCEDRLISSTSKIMTHEKYHHTKDDSDASKTVPADRDDDVVDFFFHVDKAAAFTAAKDGVSRARDVNKPESHSIEKGKQPVVVETKSQESHVSDQADQNKMVDDLFQTNMQR